MAFDWVGGRGWLKFYCVGLKRSRQRRPSRAKKFNDSPCSVPLFSKNPDICSILPYFFPKTLLEKWNSSGDLNSAKLAQLNGDLNSAQIGTQVPILRSWICSQTTFRPLLIRKVYGVISHLLLNNREPVESFGIFHGTRNNRRQLQVTTLAF